MECDHCYSAAAAADYIATTRLTLVLNVLGNRLVPEREDEKTGSQAGMQT